MRWPFMLVSKHEEILAGRIDSERRRARNVAEERAIDYAKIEAELAEVANRGVHIFERTLPGDRWCLQIEIDKQYLDGWLIHGDSDSFIDHMSRYWADRIAHEIKALNRWRR